VITVPLGAFIFHPFPFLIDEKLTLFVLSTESSQLCNASASLDKTGINGCFQSGAYGKI